MPPQRGPLEPLVSSGLPRPLAVKPEDVRNLFAIGKPHLTIQGLPVRDAQHAGRQSALGPRIEIEHGVAEARFQGVSLQKNQAAATLVH